MKTEHRTIHGEDAYRANVRLHSCVVQAKRKANSAVLFEQGQQQGHDLFGDLALLVLAHIAAVLVRTNKQ